ncbi:ABC-type multidrug transport system, ATPase component [Halorubrum aquaticum]|uniref:ABC-type multidrug transport system, ATPase component n=1 Tax=Halorubrum aquaticum TaxID=387340 RepID=A0A1I2Z3A2_9EURY|nr:ABC transporter ATP-binding protein [Halorubrum aquaticum]SFH32019.1 ABC-type multidrug transport system, ATPase component [Halorubrum aquaticum]
MSDGPFAELSGVTRTYGGVAVLEDVSLAVRPGVTAVIGPNGSGKSTLLGVLAGAVDPTDGRVRYVGPAVDRAIGYLPQRVPFREEFTARETLAFYARLAGDDPDESLERVGLSDAADRRVGALSGGMRRLLGIAQATVGDPPLVVLDEPASGLDPGMCERAFRTAADASGADTAVVVSSHDLDLVDEHADRVVVLDRGRVVAAGPRDRLCSDRGVDDVAGLYRAVVAGDAVGADEGVREERSAVHVTGVSER